MRLKVKIGVKKDKKKRWIMSISIQFESDTKLEDPSMIII